MSSGCVQVLCSSSVQCTEGWAREVGFSKTKQQLAGQVCSGVPGRSSLINVRSAAVRLVVSTCEGTGRNSVNSESIVVLAPTGHRN